MAGSKWQEMDEDAARSTEGAVWDVSKLDHLAVPVISGSFFVSVLRKIALPFGVYVGATDVLETVIWHADMVFNQTHHDCQAKRPEIDRNCRSSRP